MEKIENLKQKSEEGELTGTFFVWESFMVILSKNLFDGTQSGTQFWNLGFKNQKITFSIQKNLKFEIYVEN